MIVDPIYNAVGSFFSYKPIYYVPKYQRGYAWEKLEVEDFLKDLDKCFTARLAGNEINHFFGGIVSVKKVVAGAVNQHSYELVDGQQRMATFVLVISAVISIYRDLSNEAVAAGDAANNAIILNRINDLKQRFIAFDQEINRVRTTQDVLSLSRADLQFYKDTISGNNPAPTRDSHRKIETAYSLIRTKIQNLSNQPLFTDKLDRLEMITNIVDIDFSILHIVTADRNEAYTLFQVLNDRGKSLTEGDLLRAKTLELLETHNVQQDSVEVLWDDILSDKASQTEDYLRWIFASHLGKRAGKNTLFDDYLDEFYPSHNNDPVTAANATEIQTTTQTVKSEVELSRKLISGEWPYTPNNPITAWDRNRLTLLILELGHTLSMPLLLSAASQLNHSQFSQIVQVIERFVFRYIVVSNQHAGPVVNVYHEEALAIRANPAGYNVNTLIVKLRNLQNANAGDAIFRANLDSLMYKVGGGNKPLKYFLMTIEHFLRWYRNGANGIPTCIDKTRIYDFTDTTIEHIYPRNAQGAVIDVNLEGLKNTCGNLTFMGPTDNVAGANDDFAHKVPIFQASSVLMNLEIGALAVWNQAAVNTRMNDLKDIAVAVFRV